MRCQVQRTCHLVDFFFASIPICRTFYPTVPLRTGQIG